jgi:L-fuconolactonase
MRIDAHQHFWTLARGDYRWLTPQFSAIYRDFTPQDLAPHLAKHRIDATILVQAADSVEETRFMLGLARNTSFIAGVVGWVDFEADDACAQLEELAGDPKLRGIRPMIQDIADPDWMLRESLTPVFRKLVALGLRFDALVLPRHLKNLHTLLRRHPDLAVVIDHGAKPPIRAREIEPWASELAALARDTQAHCKVSGLATEAAAAWTANDLRPYVDHLLTSFTPARLIWGSDWPVLELAGSYDAWVEATQSLLAALSSAEQAAILGGNAAAFYGISK